MHGHLEITWSLLQQGMVKSIEVTRLLISAPHSIKYSRIPPVQCSQQSFSKVAVDFKHATKQESELAASTRKNGSLSYWQAQMALHDELSETAVQRYRSLPDFAYFLPVRVQPQNHSSLAGDSDVSFVDDFDDQDEDMQVGDDCEETAEVQLWLFC